MKNFPISRAIAVFGASGLLVIALASSGSPLVAQEPILRATLKGHDTQVWCVSISRDGKLLASGDGTGFVRLWDLVAAKETGKVEGTYMALSTDGKILVTVGADGAGTKLDDWRTLMLWDVPAAKRADK